ncbi:MAG: Ig-like domain-containing protein [Dehalococcoidia bacterium]
MRDQDQQTQRANTGRTTPSMRSRFVRLALAAVAIALVLPLTFRSTQLTQAQTVTYSIWPASAVPPATDGDTSSTIVGVKFRSDVAGFISGIRFYKAAVNTGVHTGKLWTAAGVELGSVTFTGETASGWQQATFATPIAIAANTTYIASYIAPAGRYSVANQGFANAGVDAPPLRALQNGVDGGNGVYAYSASHVFPSNTYQSENYWVDVVFVTSSGPDTTPPTVTAIAPAAGATNVTTTAAVTATFSEPMDAATISTSTFELRQGTASGPLVSAAVTYNASTLVATLQPSVPLALATTYTAIVKGGGTDPRVKDVATNALAANHTWAFTTAATDPCGTNAITAENCLTGNPASEWDVSGIGDASIQGYATNISVNRGTTVSFKISTTASAYVIDIYRLGYYGGMGARKVATVNPSASLPQSQPSCLSNAATGLVDCGNWAVSASWAVPANATSGVYIARPRRADNGGASHIVFIVRDDASTSDIVFQTADTSWQAYNSYGGNSFYSGSPAGRAYKLSYNRPFNTRIVDNGQDWLFNAEYPMIRWLERNGYNVSYITGVDADRAGALIANHKLFLSVGHDEYWSNAQRLNVEAARNAGTSLAFLSGNEVYWKVRWENSIDASGTAYRTLVCYKETHANAKIDPDAAWTGTWRDPRFSPPSDGGRPENALTGTLFTVNDGATTSIVVPEADGKMRIWRNTTVATLAPGQSATFPHGTLGYEWDEDIDNGFRPAGLVRMSQTTVPNAPVLVDYGSTFGSGTAVHRLTLYRHASGALVFGAGTVQWAWGLDATHDRGSAAADSRMQQATVNMFADMAVQPATLQAGLVGATQSSDVTPPTSTITSPINGATINTSTSVTVTGTATDTGGGVVGAVEVSTDNGATWHPATGRASWSYTFTTPSTSGTRVIRSRAADDSARLETPSAGVTINVGTDTTPPTVTATSPANAATGVAVDANVTATFSEPMTASTITATTFELRQGGAAGPLVPGAVTYNAATRIATLDPTASLLSNTLYTAIVRSGASGVRDANNVALAADFTWSFTAGLDTTPPTVTANTPLNGATGVALGTSVTATFSEDMTAATISTATFELRDPANALVAAAVVYNAATRVATLTPSVPLTASTTYTATVLGGAVDPRAKDLSNNALAANVSWSFTTGAPDTTPPTITTVTPANAATGVATATTVTATFSEDMSAATISTATFELRGPANALVTAAVAYNAASRVATLTPSAPLAAGTVYTATVLGGGVDPRAKDAVGNALAANVSWSFTTASGPACPCSIWAPSSTPSTITQNDASAVVLGVKFTSDVAGYVTGIRFYKGPSNTGIHTGKLWTAAGAELANVTFSGETASGWQQATFATPVLIAANTTYIASYQTAVGFYSINANYYGAATDSPPLRALSNAAAGGNGVYVYGAAHAFPTSSFEASNYWVDVVFVTSVGPDTTPPTVIANTPLNGAAGVALGIAVTATFSEDMDLATISGATFELRNPANALVTAIVTYNAATRVATLTPSAPLTVNTTYTARVLGGATDPRAKDLAGNALAANATWSFTTIAGDIIPPTVIANSPLNGATGVSTGTTVTATFSEDMDAATISTATFEFRNPANALLTATVSYNAATRVATLTPSAPLAAATTYTATVLGGATDPRGKDLAGNALAANVSWSFTTASGPACPCSIWAPSATPPVIDGDTSSTVVGVRFRSDVSGYITGIRFYKGAANTGTHTGKLWSSAGVELANVTFTGETASGWQEATFATPVAITANTTYIASYLAPVGRYGVTSQGFATAGIAAPPLHALQDGVDGPNGVYFYSASHVFPSNTFQSENYWVDVVFTTSVAPDTTAPTVTATSPLNGATAASTATTVTATFNEAMDAATITSATVALRDPANALVAGTVTYNAATRVATLTPSVPLAPNTLYTATVLGGALDPRAKDIAGNALAANVSWSFTTAGLLSRSITFDGTNDYVTVPHAASLNIASTMTIETFAKPTATPTNRRGLVVKTTWEINATAPTTGAGVRFEFRTRTTATGTFRTIITGNFPLNQWYHVAATYDGTTMRLFVNGVQQGTGLAATGAIDSTAAVFMGATSATAGRFPGLLDEVRLSNMVRYAANFTPTAAAFAPDANTRALWHFNEGTGTAAADVSGNANIGTLVNGPTWNADVPVP